MEERKIIEIQQDVERFEQGQYNVLMTVTDEDVILSKEYSYFRSNGIYPCYKSLVATLRNYENVHVNFNTTNRYFSTEINNISQVKSTLGTMLSEVLDKNNITITSK